jgi:hypothetical protein
MARKRAGNRMNQKERSMLLMPIMMRVRSGSWPPRSLYMAPNTGMTNRISANMTRMANDRIRRG